MAPDLRASMLLLSMVIDKDNDTLETGYQRKRIFRFSPAPRLPGIRRLDRSGHLCLRHP